MILLHPYNCFNEFPLAMYVHRPTLINQRRTLTSLYGISKKSVTFATHEGVIAGLVRTL